MRAVARSVALVLLTGVAPGQELLFEHRATGPAFAVGLPAAFFGDTDGDGWTDIAASAAAINSCGQGRGHIAILSGRDGSQLRLVEASDCDYDLSRPKRAGDWNGDGVGDYVVNRRPTTISVPNPVAHVSILSGSDDCVLTEFSGPGFGGPITNLDLDADGRPDIVISVPNEPPGGAVYAYANSGALLYKFAFRSGGLPGVVGDMNGDGCDDYVIPGGPPGQPVVVKLFSGKDGTELATGSWPGRGIGGAFNLGCGDIDGDGVLDFVSSNPGGAVTGGAVAVFSGATGARLWSRAPETPSNSYGRALSSGDLDRDGIHDLLIGVILCNGAGGPEWRSLRGFDFVRGICRPPGSASPNGFGNELVIGPVQPDHPFPVFLTHEPFFASSGRILLYRVTPASVQPRGPACAGTLAQPPRFGLTPYESHTTIHLSAAPPATPAVLLVGESGAAVPHPVPFPLSPFGFPGCSLAVPAQLAVPVLTDDTGHASLDIPAPAPNGIPGIQLEGQWLVLAAGPYAPGGLSEAMTWGH